MRSFLVDNRSDTSLAHRLRRRRFARFLQLIEDLPRPVRVLDVGGTPTYWRQMGVALGEDVELTVINVDYEGHTDPAPGVRCLTGDARDLSAYEDGAFDVAYSNSVIEHVGPFEDQLRMATEVRRVARRYLVQTPNYYFPVEPHFVFPLFQFLPIPVRATLVQRLPIAWSGRVRDRQKAIDAVSGIRLLRRDQLEELFPDAEIVPEKIGGLVKSWMMIRREPGAAGSVRD
jgi:hypothetical protein